MAWSKGGDSVVKLSPNFSLSELTFSPTAVRLGINNEPDAEQIKCLSELVTHVLQPLRDYFARPVTINSGYRSNALNRAVGGAIDSQHTKGQAADIRIIGFTNDLLWQYIDDNLPYDQLILEHVPAKNAHQGWVHVSYREPLRREALSCIANGLTVNGLAYAD